MACAMSTVIGFTKGTVSGAHIVLYLGRNFKSVSRSILDLGSRVMEASRPSFQTPATSRCIWIDCDSPALSSVINEL